MSDQPDMIGMPGDVESLLGRDLSDVPEGKWAPLLANMVSVLEARFLRQGMTADQAFNQARDSVLATAEYFGGRMIYLPRGDRLKLALRDAEIFHRANANNIKTLATEFEVTDIQIYRIIRQQRALHISKVQRRLPFE